MAKGTDGHTATDTRSTAADSRWRLGYPIAFLVLLVSLVVVFSAWSNARQRELKLAEAAFQSSVGQLASLVHLRLTSFEITLRGGTSLFATLKWPSQRTGEAIPMDCPCRPASRR